MLISMIKMRIQTNIFNRIKFAQAVLRDDIKRKVMIYQINLDSFKQFEQKEQICLNG